MSYPHPTAQNFALFTASIGITQSLLEFINPITASRVIGIRTDVPSPFIRLLGGRSLGSSFALLGCWYLGSPKAMGVVMMGCAIGALTDAIVTGRHGSSGSAWLHGIPMILITSTGLVLLT